MFVLGAIALGLGLSVAAVALVTKFWNEVRDWLNHTAADVVQRYIGYDARKAMQKAVCKADRIINKIRNIAQVYYRSTPLATYYDKVTMEVTDSTANFDKEFLNTIDQQGSIVQEMNYVM